jgi:hypothetical protein
VRATARPECCNAAMLHCCTLQCCSLHVACYNAAHRMMHVAMLRCCDAASCKPAHSWLVASCSFWFCVRHLAGLVRGPRVGERARERLHRRPSGRPQLRAMRMRTNTKGHTNEQTQKEHTRISKPANANRHTQTQTQTHAPASQRRTTPTSTRFKQTHKAITRATHKQTSAKAAARRQ